MSEHHCQAEDDAFHVTRNLLLLARFANPSRLPPFPPERSLELLALIPGRRLARYLRPSDREEEES